MLLCETCGEREAVGVDEDGDMECRQYAARWEAAVAARDGVARGVAAAMTTRTRQRVGRSSTSSQRSEPLEVADFAP